MQSVNKYFSPHAVTCVCLFEPDGNLTPKDADEKLFEMYNTVQNSWATSQLCGFI